MSQEVTGLDTSRKRPVESSDRPSCINLERSTSSDDAASKKSDKPLTRSSLNSSTEDAKDDKGVFALSIHPIVLLHVQKA